MKNLIVILGIGLSTLVAFGQPIEAKFEVTLEDASGDVQESGDEPGADVTKVSITSDGQSINVDVVLTQDIAKIFASKKAGAVITIHTDADNDADTGGKPFWYKKAGFEFKTSVITCLEYKDGTACMGGLSGPVEAFMASCKTEEYQEGSSSIKDLKSAMESMQGKIEGNTISVSLPYSDIAGSPGKKVRLAIRECDGPYNDSSFFPEVLLTLK